MVFHMVDADAYGHAAELADDRGPGRACHPHGRQAQPAENKDRVQDDVHHGARHLADHLVTCSTRSMVTDMNSPRENTVTIHM